MLRSDRTLICNGCCDACEGQALALRLRRRADRATVVRGPSRLYPRDAGFPASPTLPPQSLILDILQILAILLQTIAIKVLTDLFCLLLRCSIDIKVFQTFFFLILAILIILAILLQNIF